jgi:hypothetical protein
MHLAPGSGAFLAKSKKQTILADSSTVAEWIAAHSAAQYIMWARSLLEEMGFAQTSPTVLHEDNQSTIYLLNNPGNGNKTKHIALRYNFLRDEIENGTIIVQYLPSGDMTSDILTKALPTGPFLHLRPQILGM